MYRECLKGSLNPVNFFKTLKFKIDDFRAHPFYMRTFGTCIFCGPQGSGKTLSAVNYIKEVLRIYPRAMLVSNTAIKEYPFTCHLESDGKGGMVIVNNKSGEIINTQWILDNYNTEYWEPVVLEYSGLDDLKFVNNNEYGVLYFIDEFHLELNSLESKNVDIETMIEISQQRKQRKHIVGTSQIFMRLAKPLREQVHDVILCKNIFNAIQVNKWIDGNKAYEENGKLIADTKGTFIFFHTPAMYNSYDTYAKMKRYNSEWQGHKRENIFNSDNSYTLKFKGGIKQ